ncbi:MAG: hypothetical protein RLZZ123_586 [Pseudomonadota bacterium]|jgi:hypothetical protein
MSSNQNQASRRRFFVGAGAVGAATAVATVATQLPSVPAQAQAETPPPERGGGYKVSEHIQRYYRSARV